MYLPDYVLMLGLLGALLFWWGRSGAHWLRVVLAFASLALAAGVYAVLDDRWQAAVGLVAASVFFLAVGLARIWLVLAIVSLALAIGAYAVLDYVWQAAVGLAAALAFFVAAGIARLRRSAVGDGRPYGSGSLMAILCILAGLALYWFPVPDLPPPSGPHAVGVRDFELRDETRLGLLAAGPEEPRRLLVRVWYPAQSTAGFERRPYFTEQEAGSTAASFGEVLGFPLLFKHLKHSATNSHRDAPLLADAEALPVVIYSHGYTSFLGQNTVLAEELASHGYLLFSIQHTYDSADAVFPNGDILPRDPQAIEEMMALMEGGPPQEMLDAFIGESFSVRRTGHIADRAKGVWENQRLAARSPAIWRDDRMFVHDQLEQGAVPEAVREIAAAGNFAATGQIGMSFGGSTTGGVCMRDRRCAAGVNLDGGDYDFKPFDKNMPAPFMMLYSDLGKLFEQLGAEPGGKAWGYNDFSYERHDTAGLRSDIYRLQVKEVAHLGVSDFPLFFRNPVRGLLLGSIDSDAILGIQNDFVRGFFDKHLRGLQSDFPAPQFAKHGAWAIPYDIAPLRAWWLERMPEDRTERVVLETALGEVEIALYPERAPISAGNFLAYVDAGHYDGASFYRAVRKSDDEKSLGIVQGGIMASAMAGTQEDFSAMAPPLPPIAHETTLATGIPNERGAIAYGRLAPGTASSEFFINLSDNPVLDTGQGSPERDGFGYAAFGRVLRGMRVLEAIQSRPADGPTGIELVKGQILAEPVRIERAYRVQ